MKIREPRLDSYQLPEEEALRRHFLIAFGWGSSEEAGRAARGCMGKNSPSSSDETKTALEVDTPEHIPQSLET